jgi:tetratricopeptide (TPR) repeat protein
MKTLIIFMYLLANNLFAQSQTLNDSVFMGLKLPPNNEQVKLMVKNLEDQVNSTRCWFLIEGKYKWRPNLKIFDNRLELFNSGTPLKTIYFVNIINNIQYASGPSYGINYDYIWFDENTGVCFKKDQGNIFYTNLTSLVDILKKAQSNYKATIMNNQLAEFKMKSSEYLSKEVKPDLSEEQRKFVVQANAASEEKKYALALEMYDKVFQINPYSYPQGYYNAALIAAQQQDFALAIFNMNKYIILSPNAEDTRKAQDKIYEWEMYIKN